MAATLASLSQSGTERRKGQSFQAESSWPGVSSEAGESEVPAALCSQEETLKLPGF